MIRRPIAALAACWLAWTTLTLAPARGADWPPRGGLRVVFLGDSITQAGTYVRYIDGYLATRFPDRPVEIIGLGLSSETAAGTSEPGHPYPRPDIHARLARALELARPDLVFVCYGMNDGIYAPPDPDRIDRYRRGIADVVAAARQVGASVIVGTPPPFDARPIRERTAPLSATEFTYKNPYLDYDGVLGLYAGLLLDRRAEGWAVADVHGASRDALDALRTADPNFTLATDGVHPGGDGHWLIARAYLEAWGASSTPEVDSAVVDAKDRAVVRGQVGLVDSGPDDDSLRLTWTTRIPLPRDPAWDARLVRFERLDDRFNRHRLAVVGLSAPRYAIYEDARPVGEASRAELAAGLDLLRFPQLSSNRRAAEVFALIERKHAALRPAWLEEVGHGPPNFARAPTVAEATAATAPVVAEIRRLATPAPINLRLVPIGG